MEELFRDVQIYSPPLQQAFLPQVLSRVTRVVEPWNLGAGLGCPSSRTRPVIRSWWQPPGMGQQNAASHLGLAAEGGIGQQESAGILRSMTSHTDLVTVFWNRVAELW